MSHQRYQEPYGQEPPTLVDAVPEDTRPDPFQPPEPTSPSTVWSPGDSAASDVGLHTLILGGVIATAGIVIVGIVVIHLVKANEPLPPPPPDYQQVATQQYEEEVEEEPQLPLEQQPKFSIRSEPMGAAVFVGKKRLGRTPFVLRGEEVDGSRVTLRYEMSGYGAVEHKVRLTDGGVADVTLAPIGGGPSSGFGGLPFFNSGGNDGLGDLRSGFMRMQGGGGGYDDRSGSPEGALVVGED